MLGNEAAISVLRRTESGLVLIHGDIGTGKTSAALALVRERTGVWLDEFGSDRQTYKLPDGGQGLAMRYLATDMERGLLWPSGLYTPSMFYRQFIHILDEAQDIPRKVLSRMRIANTPPKGWLYIFCTSEPMKLDRAIRDRCTSVALGRLGMADITRLAERTCAELGVTFDGNIGTALARYEIQRPRAIIAVIDYLQKGMKLDDAIRTVMPLG